MTGFAGTGGSRVRGLARRISVGALPAMLLAACNDILGIGEPVDPTAQSRAAAGNAGTNEVSAGTGAVGRGSSANGGNAGKSAGGGSGPRKTGGVAGVTGGQAGGTGGEAGAPGMGGEAGDSGIAPVRITTSTLPKASVNVRFDFRFRATGGFGRFYTWSTSDDLPDGLELTADGVLRGVPVREGDFDIEVRVEEERTSDSDIKRFALRIVRKRWLVFTSDEATIGEFLLYAVDVTEPSKPKIPLVRTENPGFTSVQQYAFSPDGSYLAFTAATNGRYDLYVVDMTGPELREPDLVGVENVVAGDFAWSPDSRHIAYATSSGPMIRLIVLDLATPMNAITVGQTTFLSGFGWVNQELFTHSGDGALAYTRRPFVETHEERYLPVVGWPQQVWPELDAALFRTRESNCMGGVWSLVSFRESPVAVSTFISGVVYGSPGLDYVAWREPRGGQYSISPAFGLHAIATFNSPLQERYCSPGAWSNDGLVFVAGGEGDRLMVATIRGEAASVRSLAGSYGAVGEREPPAFSSDDEWLGFATDTGVFLAKKSEAGEFGSVLAVHPSVHSALLGDEPLIRFAPNSKFLAFAEAGAAEGTVRAFVADLDEDVAVGEPLPLPNLQEGSRIAGLGWSVHSTELALRVQTAALAPTELHLVTHADTSNPVITKLNGPMTCTDFYSPCQMVWDFAFQP